MKRHFRVVGQLDGTGAPRPGKVTIADGFFQVRPYRRRRVYELPLSTVADFVCKRIIFMEHAEKRAAKKKKGRRSR